MKVIKYLLLLLLIVIIGGAIYFGTQDGTYDVAVSKNMNAPAEVIYNNVKDYKNWEAWGPWMKTDETMEISYAEKTSGEGGSYSWTADEAGDGSMKTVKVIPNKEIDQKITFNTPLGDSESDVYWRFNENAEGGTEVVWGMRGEQSLMEKAYMAFQEEDFETTLKGMFQQGLDSLNQVVMKELETYSVNVNGITRYGGGYYMYMTTAAKQSELSEKMGVMYGQIMSFMQDNNIQMSGMPFTIYNEMDEATGSFIFSAAIPVKERIITPQGSAVQTGFMEPTQAVKTVLKGNYNNLDKAYAEAEAYIEKNNLSRDPATPMFEIYANDPGEFPNPADWLTEIYIPIIPQSPAN